jgi:hypothetical protein
MKSYTLSFEVEARNQESAIREVIERLNMGGQPDSVEFSGSLMHVDSKLFTDLIADRKRLLDALTGVIHHNDGVREAYKLPASLIRHIKQAVTNV